LCNPIGDWRLDGDGRSLHKVYVIFNTLGLSDAIVRAVTEARLHHADPDPGPGHPAVLGGGDLLAGAQTGTGKTAGFTLPMLHRLSTDKVGAALTSKTSKRPIRALVLTPTRELAAQVEESVRTYGKYTNLNSAVIFGGVGINPQIKQLASMASTSWSPRRAACSTTWNRAPSTCRQVEILILDEADRMLDMGFIHDIKKVLARAAAEAPEPAVLGHLLGRDQGPGRQAAEQPGLIEVARRNSTVEVIAQN
jgi:ATP-dependent RNA helicase RhlE